MTRNEAYEIVYALRDYIESLRDQHLTFAYKQQLQDKLVEALVQASNYREGEDC